MRIYPSDIAVNPNTDMIYVANERSNSISVIDGNIDNVVTGGVVFNINPHHTALVRCDNKEFATGVYLILKVGMQCEAIANNGFQFSSWTEDLGKNASKTITTSPISDSWTYLLNKIGFLKDNSAFKISNYGNFTANFRESPSPIPPEYLLAIFAFILSTITPCIVRWFNGWRQRRNLDKYLIQKKLESIKNISALEASLLRKEITQLYIQGKISQNEYNILDKRISEDEKK